MKLNWNFQRGGRDTDIFWNYTLPKKILHNTQKHECWRTNALKSLLQENFSQFLGLVRILSFWKYSVILIFKPPREMKIGLKNWIVQEIRGKIAVFDWEEGNDLDVELLRGLKNEWLRNRATDCSYSSSYENFRKILKQHFVEPFKMALFSTTTKTKLLVIVCFVLLSFFLLMELTSMSWISMIHINTI